MRKGSGARHGAGHKDVGDTSLPGEEPAAGHTPPRPSGRWAAVGFPRRRYGPALPLRLAWQGARFRLPVDHGKVSQGLLSIGDSLPAYLPRNFPLERVRLIDMAGTARPC